ncbi:MAG TPA: hypothetical protein VF635_00355, partial [Propionibacteriaceae bacterium]
MIPDLTGWEDVVTSALLGTDRRPLPSSATSGTQATHLDPARVLLDLAAAHRAVTLVGQPPRDCAAPPLAPSQVLSLAPSPAQDLLAGLLGTPEPALVNLWMAACAQRGLGVAAEHWARLAELAARATGYDRALLRQVLGGRGAWFLQQNPRWAQLASEQSAPAGTPGQLAGTGPVGPGAADLTRQQVQVGLELIASGSLGPQTRPTAERLAGQLPLSLADLVTGDWAPVDPTLSIGPALRRTVEL